MVFYHPGFLSTVQLSVEIKPKPHHSWLVKYQVPLSLDVDAFLQGFFESLLGRYKMLAENM